VQGGSGRRGVPHRGRRPGTVRTNGEHTVSERLQPSTGREYFQSHLHFQQRTSRTQRMHANVRLPMGDTGTPSTRPISQGDLSTQHKLRTMGTAAHHRSVTLLLRWAEMRPGGSARQAGHRSEIHDERWSKGSRQLLWWQFYSQVTLKHRRSQRDMFSWRNFFMKKTHQPDPLNLTTPWMHQCAQPSP
jgi:hypothetical protein